MMASTPPTGLRVSLMTAAPPPPATPPAGFPSGREAVLRAVTSPDQLRTHPIVALRVVEAASRPNCRPSEIVTLLNQDPTLCARLLKAVNSAAYGLPRAVGSIDRAVIAVGMNKVRGLALGLSLPEARPKGRYDTQARDHALASVGGAILARELAVRVSHPAPEDALAAGLLRDVGGMMMQQAFPDAWAAVAAKGPDPLGEYRCDREREVFGIDHAELAAEVFAGWNLPADIAEPIRHHHAPDRLANGPKLLADRARLLWFSGLLARIDTLVEHPAELDRVLFLAEDRYDLDRAELAEFMQGVWPKIDDYARLLSRDVGPCPNYVSIILKDGSDELARLSTAPISRGG